MMMGICRLLLLGCLVVAPSMTLVAAQVAPTTAPVPRSGSGAAAAAVCSTIQFRRKLLVSFRGRPGNITNADIQLFQRSFQQVYNSIKCGINATLTFRQITTVNATRNAILSYGFSSINTASDFVDQQFTWIVQLEGTCRGCTTPTFQLFAIDPPAPSPPTPPSSPPPPGCFCSPPRKISFLRSLNRPSLLPNAIDQVLDIVILFEQNRCPAVESQFEAFVAVAYTGGSNTTTANLTKQNQLLAQSVLETYNDANALNTAGVCDTQYHSLTSIQVVAASVPSGVLLRSFRDRRDLATSSTFNRNFFFRLRGRCRGCSSATALFNDVVGRRRRRNLEEEDMVTTNDETTSFLLHHHVATTTQVTAYPNELSAFTDSYHRQLPVIDGQCYCQAITRSRRIPDKVELIQALNDRFEDIGPQGAGVVTIASAVQNIAQVFPVNCSTSVNKFTTTVVVGIRANKTIPSAELAKLGTAFQTTYNALTHTYCDPLFRVVKSVQVKYRRRELLKDDSSEKGNGADHRGLQQQRVGFLRFVVQGQCLGCSSSAKLFADGANRALQSPPRAANDWWSSTTGPSEPMQKCDSSRTRLQAANQPTTVQTCYCRANSIALTAPPANAFQKAFNQSVTALDKSLAVYSVS